MRLTTEPPERLADYLLKEDLQLSGVAPPPTAELTVDDIVCEDRLRDRLK